MNSNQILFYSTPQGNIKVEVIFKEETFWLTQKAMAALFGVEVPGISKHLSGIYETNELQKEATISILETVQQEGSRKVKRKVEYYRLEAILAVGYRVNSAEATQFRIWATNTLKEFIIKGFILDDERLKQGKSFGKDYFYELLERIREIRSSERRFYQKITDLYALCVDYNKEAEITKDFFTSVQNKLHWAITGKTAAEIIYTKADAKKIYMGLKTWKHAPDEKILKSDVSVAKNYLNEAHISESNSYYILSDAGKNFKVMENSTILLNLQKGYYDSYFSISEVNNLILKMSNQLFIGSKPIDGIAKEALELAILKSGKIAPTLKNRL